MYLEEKERLSEWALARMPGHKKLLGAYEAIGCRMNGELTAVALFENFSDGDVSVGLVVEKRATKGFVKRVFDYVFNQARCQRMSCEIAATNIKSIQLANDLGFVLEGKKRAARPDDESYHFGLLRSECRWL